jgi:hypothetical protein
MSDEYSASLIVMLALLVAAAVLFHPRVSANASWRATVTPLASIIGSGFLVLAPLLVREFGTAAVWVMAALCALAYAVGAAIRWNILALDGEHPDFGQAARRIEAAASWVLAFAYVISVCYYLNLFGAFAMSMTPFDGVDPGRWMTTAVLIFIAVLGWRGGLKSLEHAETISVGIKLAVIAGLLAGMGYYTHLLAAREQLQHNAGHFDWNSLRLAFGLIITVQGFETSRYLSEGHDAATRVRTMRYAQWLATVIYLIYIGLAGLSFPPDSVGLRETAVIGMTRAISPLLPILLVIAALAAQFSAAVADTNGCGGLAQEMSHGRVPTRSAYLVLVALAVVLTWSANIYQIISYASRAFAGYYALQCALATLISYRGGTAWWRTLAFAALTLLLLAAGLLGLPAE